MGLGKMFSSAMDAYQRQQERKALISEVKDAAIEVAERAQGKQRVQVLSANIVTPVPGNPTDIQRAHATVERVVANAEVFALTERRDNGLEFGRKPTREELCQRHMVSLDLRPVARTGGNHA